MEGLTLQLCDSLEVGKRITRALDRASLTAQGGWHVLRKDLFQKTHESVFSHCLCIPTCRRKVPIQPIRTVAIVCINECQQLLVELGVLIWTTLAHKSSVLLEKPLTIIPSLLCSQRLTEIKPYKAIVEFSSVLFLLFQQIFQVLDA